MATRFASYNKSYGFCDICSQRCQLKDMKKVYIMGKLINSKRCKECWDPDHPQNFIPILAPPKLDNDPQALREPRPDTNRNQSCTDYAFDPVATLVVYTTLNNVNVTGFTTVAPTFRPVPPIMGPVDM